ncbi:MAG: acetate--CoA ligase family protein [Candidatus Zambryskibacteria bacterium]|nr:acetate--CoA ligase family protein [Candidatus Zambryskibacteria bacterium]
MIEKFFDPKSIVIVGASSNPKKVGFALVSNLVGNNSRKIYPVTLNEKEILGLPTFVKVSDIQDEVELAIIAVPAKSVPEVLSNCGEKNIKNAIIISSGFKETGLSGAELENQIKEIAERFGITLLGPNCLGIIDANNGLNLSFAGQKPLAGSIAFLSQSGALGTSMIDWAIKEGIGFSKFISLGNEALLTEIEFLEYLEKDPKTKAILMYLENIADGAKFIDVLSKITKSKPVVVIKAGMGSHGNLAVMSHTGALAPKPAVFISACKQAGAVTVSSLRGVFDVIKILSQNTDINKPAQRLIILTNGGGPSVIAADLVDRSESLTLTELSNETKEKLRQILPLSAAVGNPVDILGDALAERYEQVLDILIKIDEADAIIVILTPQMMTEPVETAKVLVKYKNKHKVFPVFIGGSSIEPGRNELIKSGIVCFEFPRNIIDALDYLARGAGKIKPPHYSKGLQRDISYEAGKMIEFEEMHRIFSDYGISISGKFVSNKENLPQALRECGEGPYAAKVISQAAVHKTEAGAIKLYIKNGDEARLFWEEMEQKLKSFDPQASVDGVLVQKMAKGREIIIGMKRDNTFGPVILFGLGGILAEAIKDTALRVAPVEREEALKMMKEIKGVKILEGLRGQPPVNFEALADIIVKLSKLSLEHPEIKEIDLNPVMATEDTATIVDARMMV